MKPSHSAQIMLGLVTGLATGLFFGESVASLSVVGDVFIGLLQMTVLPFIGVTLISSFGKLSWRDSRRLAWVGGLVLVFLWSIALLTIVMISLAFPDWQSGSFFSSAILEPGESKDLLAYFIPSNVFEAFSENQIPAVVLFCIFAGLALSRVDGRHVLLPQLDAISEVLLRITKSINRLAPVGIFAICASTAGTLSMAELSRLQAYWIAYTGGAMFLGLVALPLLVTTLTPISYVQMLRVIKEPAITAFVTGKLVIVLPMLVENTDRILRECLDAQADEAAPETAVLYSASYPFPNVGKLLTMLFIPFAAWFLGNPIPYLDYPGFLSAGLVAYFGGPLLAIPALLDQMRLPHDMFQLFVVSGVFDGRLSDALGAVHLATFSLITGFGFRRSLSIEWRGVLRFTAVSLLAGCLLLVSTQSILGRIIAGAEQKHDVLARLQLLEKPVSSTVFVRPAPNPDPLLPGESLLERVRRRGLLRIGFNEDKVPFAFYNETGQLVGYDINMAHAFARDLGVGLEFVRFDRPTLADQIRDDDFDLVMSGLVGTLERSEQMEHTANYLDVNLALITADFRAREFQSIDAMQQSSQLRIGFVDLTRGFVERLQESIPDAELIEIPRYQDFFDSDGNDFDALLISAESGSFFALLHPEYEVVRPAGLSVKLPLFYAVGNQDIEMRRMLEHWVSLRQKDGTAAEFYEHWILGKVKADTAPRWCIARDVLHWID